ncbi:hypothetical protein GIB67_034842, partial [Kingdonia uniflora]
MQDLAMSSAEKEYDETDDELEFKSDEDEGYVSQIRFLLGKKQKITYEELNVSTEPPPPLPENYEPRDIRRLTQSDGKGHLSTSVATTSTYLDHTKVNIKDSANTNIIFRAFMLLYYGCVLFENLKSWARIELLGPIAIIEKKGLAIDFDSAILGYLYYCLDQASKQEYQYYEYCQIGHHILIYNRLDNFWPRMSGWHIKRRKLTGNKAKHHLALMRQQLDLPTMNNIKWDPFRNMKDTLKDHCWAQLEHRVVPYDPPEKLHCFPSPNMVRSLRAAGWIKAQYYIVGHLVDYDAYWRHASHGTLMSDITRCGNIDIPGLSALTARVTFPYLEFPTGDFYTHETQISPPQLGYDFFDMTEGMRKLILDRTLDLEARHLHDESCITHLTTDLKRTEGRLSQLIHYLGGEGIVVDWEDDEGEAGTSRGSGSRGRRSRGRTSK